MRDRVVLAILDDPTKECTGCYSSCRLLKCPACSHAVFFHPTPTIEWSSGEGGGTGGEEREGEGRMKTASRGKVEWNGRTVGNRCNVHRFRVVLNGRNCRVRTKILLVSLPLPPLFRIIKETTTKMIFLLPSFGSQRNRTLANF